jgi:hypothetical protein
MSTFTEREQKLMAAACQSFEGEPKVHSSLSIHDHSMLTCYLQLDIDKVAASLCTLHRPSTHTHLYSSLSALASPSALPATPGLPSRRTPDSKSAKKRPPPVVLPAGDNVSDDEEVPTPSKKPKTPITNAKPKAKGKGKGKVAKSEDDDDDDFVKVKSEAIDEEFEEV